MLSGQQKTYYVYGFEVTVRCVLQSELTGRRCSLHTGQLTTTRAGAGLPHKQAGLPPHSQAPAGNLSVLQSHSIAQETAMHAGSSPQYALAA